MRYTVDEDAICAAERALDDAAAAVAELRSALRSSVVDLVDSGGPELAAGLEELTTRWLWALVVMGRDATTTSHVVGLAAQGYQRAEALAGTELQP